MNTAIATRELKCHVASGPVIKKEDTSGINSENTRTIPITNIPIWFLSPQRTLEKVSSPLFAFPLDRRITPINISTATATVANMVVVSVGSAKTNEETAAEHAKRSALQGIMDKTTWMREYIIASSTSTSTGIV